MTKPTDLSGLEFDGRLLTAPEETAPFLTDWRKLWTGTAMAVAQPDAAEDVAKIVRWCRERQVSIVPQGGNTGLCGGATPPRAGRNLVLSLARLNRIRAIDTVNNTLTAEAGVVLATVQAAAADAGRLFPLSLAAEGSCTIGGNLATNAGGTAVLAYGNARDLCLGLEVVTAEGEIWNGLKALRKDNTAYDLRDLFIGSEGTLGIITAAVLKLFPKPAGKAVGWVAAESPREAMGLLNLTQSMTGSTLTGFELIADAALQIVLRRHPALRPPLQSTAPWYVLVEISDSRSQAIADELLLAVLQRALDSGLIKDAVAASSLSQAAELWQLREFISESSGLEGANIKHDVSVPLSAIPDFVDQALAAVKGVTNELNPVVFGHLGDGNLHFNLVSAPGVPRQQAMGWQDQLNTVVHDLVDRHSGSISAEHGLGVLRRDEARTRKSATELRLSAAIKTALDPDGLMNPGKGLA